MRPAGFSLVVAFGFSLSSCGARAPELMGSAVFAARRHAGSRILSLKACELSRCGARAQLPRGIWDLSSLTRDRTSIPSTGRRILYHWTTKEVPALTFIPAFLLWGLNFVSPGKIDALTHQTKVPPARGLLSNFIPQEWICSS